MRLTLNTLFFMLMNILLPTRPSGGFTGLGSPGVEDHRF